MDNVPEQILSCMHNFSPPSLTISNAQVPNSSYYKTIKKKTYGTERKVITMMMVKKMKELINNRFPNPNVD